MGSAPRGTQFHDDSLCVWPFGDWKNSRLEDLELPGACFSSVIAGAVVPSVWALALQLLHHMGTH